MKKPSFPRWSSLSPATKWAGLSFFAVSVLLGFCLFLIQRDWNTAVQVLCGVYTMFIGLFFVAQLLGFVLSQTRYSESVERPKFELLEIEAKEWAK